MGTSGLSFSFAASYLILEHGHSTNTCQAFLSFPVFCSFSSNIPCASFAVSLVKEGQSAIQTPHYLLHITSYSSQKRNFHPFCLAKNLSFPLFKYVHCCMDCSAKVSGRGNHSHTNPTYSPPMTC